MEHRRLEFYEEEPEPSEDQEAIPVMLPSRVMALMQVYIYFNNRIINC